MSPASATSRFRGLRPAFADVVGDAPRLVRVADVDAHEGPVYVAAEEALYFTSLPRRLEDGSRLVAIRRLQLDGLEAVGVSTVVADANAANGMALDSTGALVVCEQGGPRRDAAITRIDRATGERGVLADEVDGVPLSSPNDVVVGRDGSIWFTDPSYGFLQGFRPPPRMRDRVYRRDPATGRTEAVADSFDKPNGIALSPDERVLYVTDSGANHEEGSFDARRPHHVKAFDVREGRLDGERVLATTVPGFPDGLKCDREGRVYASAFSGVQVFDPDGRMLGEVDLPGTVNFAWGGAARNVLFITTDTAVWAAVLNAEGA
jgi:gluconolactonase